MLTNDTVNILHPYRKFFFYFFDVLLMLATEIQCFFLCDIMNFSLTNTETLANIVDLTRNRRRKINHCLFSNLKFYRV